MMPFSLQSPENIAKEYMGNKQKIAQAAQMGMLDPTAAVLAGMFIDRMRAGAVEEQAAPPTVAQQVLGGMQPPPSLPEAMPMPPSAPQPMPAAGGLGNTPQAMQAQIPQQANPAPPQQYAAASGLMSAQVPDAMFDYADGGLVAFAGGGVADYDAWKRAIIAQESGGRYGALNDSSGAMGIGQVMPQTAMSLAKQLGIPYRKDLMLGKTGEAKNYQDKITEAALQEAWKASGGNPLDAAKYYYGGPNPAIHGPKTDKYVSDISKRLGMNGPLDLSSIAVSDYKSPDFSGDVPGLVEEGMQKYKDAVPVKDEYKNQLQAMAEQYASPEYQDKLRKTDMWETLAQIGFGMASSPSPYFLQAFGQAALAALPGSRAARKERESLKREAVKTLADLENVSNEDARKVYDAGFEYAKTMLSLKEKAAEREKDIESATVLSGSRLAAAQLKAEADARKAQAKKDADDKLKISQLNTDRVNVEKEMQLASERLQKLDRQMVFNPGSASAIEGELQRLAAQINGFNQRARALGQQEIPMPGKTELSGRLPNYNDWITKAGHTPSGAEISPVYKNVETGDVMTNPSTVVLHNKEKIKPPKTRAKTGVGQKNELGEDPLGLFAE